MEETRKEKFKRILENLMKKHKQLFQILVDDFETKKLIVARDGCAFCGGREWPCPCMYRDKFFKVVNL